MLTTYRDIFQQRGRSYHQAMQKYPQARREEFMALISLADIERGQTVADIPSGGCYLANFLGTEVNLISVETCNNFVDSRDSVRNSEIIFCQTLKQIPLASNSIDRILSLAGLHHLRERKSVWQEFYHLLSANGSLCIADVRFDSQVGGFLNIFVDRYNSEGHRGLFLGDQTTIELTSVGFKVLQAMPLTYYWQFDSQESMVEYCRLLFGLNLANSQQILAGIRDYLGYKLTDGKYYLNWELYFLKCCK